jgi:hypothetical protein
MRFSSGRCAHMQACEGERARNQGRASASMHNDIALGKCGCATCTIHCPLWRPMYVLRAAWKGSTPATNEVVPNLLLDAVGV